MFCRLSPELVLRSPWRPYRPRAGERVLVLAAATTFPPSHPTTRLCLELLAATLAEGPCPQLLDVGCGSGVLLLAGVAAGARLGVGLDLSGKAVITTRNNARANGLAAAVQVVRGSTEALRGPFKLIVANLPWAVQMDKGRNLPAGGPGRPPDPLGFQRHPGGGTPGLLSAVGLGPDLPPHPGRVGHRTPAGEELHLGRLAFEPTARQ